MGSGKHNLMDFYCRLSYRDCATVVRLHYRVAYLQIARENKIPAGFRRFPVIDPRHVGFFLLEKSDLIFIFDDEIPVENLEILLDF